MKFEMLKVMLSGHLVKKHFTRHFRRLAILEMFQGIPLAKGGVPAALSQSLTSAAFKTPDALLAELNSHSHGLDAVIATAIRERVGFNEVDHEKPRPWWLHLWHCYSNPFSLLLTVLATISYFTEDMKAAIVISLMIVLSTVLRFIQENRSNRAAEQLKRMVSNTATVLRRDIAESIAAEAKRFYGVTLHPKPAQAIEIPIRELVPGDVVVLSAGDMIPADLRLLSSKDLFINQAAITGESMPVEKFVQLSNPKAHGPIELDNILFMGTNVVSGTAHTVVVETGVRTYFGALAQRVVSTDRTPTALQTGVNQITWVLIRFMLVMTPIVLLINGFTKGDRLEAALFTLSVAVGLTPEMLPMIVTANTLEQQTLFQSGWFIEGLLSQTLIVHMIRTRKIPFIQSFPGWPLLTMTVVVMVLGVILPMSPLAHYVKLQALPLDYFPWLFAILLGYAILTQSMKGIFARRYGWQ